MNLVPDYSLFLQVLTFLVLWICLKRLLFDPVLRVLALREERTVGARARADELTAVAETDRARYQESIRAARVRLGEEAEAARKVAEEEYAALVARERAAANEELTRMRAGMQAQVAAARQTLAAEAETIATEMLERVTGGARG